jgi:hypothetical protein
MSSTTFGNNARGPNVYGQASSLNQMGSPFTVPATGTITRLGQWLEIFQSSTPTAYIPVRLCIWNASGTLLGQTASFNVPVNGSTGTNWAANLLAGVSVTAGQTVYLGFWYNHSVGDAYGVQFDLNPRCQNSGTLYLKAQGNSAPGNLTLSGPVGHTSQAYAFLTYNSIPNKPTTESYGVVVSATPTIRLYVSTPDAAPLTSLSFVITGVSPAHGPVTKTLTGSFASGSWQSYTLDPADLGWTPAAGDTLTYHGIATNSGGSTTGDESTVLTINSTSAPTITSPIAGPVIATPVLTGGTTPLVGATVAWTFNDPQGEAQSAYQVKLYADSGGSKGSLLTGADTGKVTSVAGRSASVTPTAGLTNKAYFWVGVTTWDVHDAASTEATVRTRMAWGRSDGRYDCGATPTQWALDHVSATVPANSQVVIEYASTTGGTGQTGWNQDFSTVTMRRWFHWRAWLFGWGSATPTTPSLDEIALQFTAASNVAPDNWDLTQAASKASLDVSTYRYGSQALRITCSGDSTTPYARQQIPVRPYTAYVISAFIKGLKLGGTFEAWVDLFDGANSLVASSKITATTSDFQQVVSVPYTTGAETSLWFRLMVTDGAGSAGSVAWFDAVECQASTVVTAWQPGGVGRAVAIDSGGIGVDGSAGGIARFHGTGTAANDYVELGVHGWKYGGGPELYSPDGTALSTGGAALATGALTPTSVAASGAVGGATVTAGGINVYATDSGTAFPTGAALTAYGNNRPFFRTDLDEWNYYDGTRWLSTLPYDEAIGAVVTLPISAAGATTGHRCAQPLAGITAIYVIEFGLAFFVAAGGTALGASHKWVVTLVDDAGTTQATITINSGASGAWRAAAPVALTWLPTTSNFHFDVVSTKTGTPGAIYPMPRFRYRKVAT